MVLIILVLFLGELGLAVGLGWLWHRTEELIRLQRTLSQVHQAAAARVAQIRDRRLLAEAQLRRIDGRGW